MRLRVARKVMGRAFTCGCPLPGHREYRRWTFVRALQRWDRFWRRQEAG